MNIKEPVRHRNQTSIGRLSGYNGFEFGLAVNRSGRCLHPKGCCGGVEWRQVVVGKRRCCRIEQKSGSIDAGRNLSRGGPMLSGHTSHQIGLDADIWLTPMPERELPCSEGPLTRGYVQGAALHM